MLSVGTLNVEQAADLLKALGPSKEESLPLPPPPAWTMLAPPDLPPTAPQAPLGRVKPRFVRIRIDASKGEGAKTTKVDVNVPIALAKFALKFLPNDAKAELSAQGIDITQVLEGFDSELSQGKILDLNASEDDDSGSTHISIEVI